MLVRSDRKRATCVFSSLLSGAGWGALYFWTRFSSMDQVRGSMVHIRSRVQCHVPVTGDIQRFMSYVGNNSQDTKVLALGRQ